MTIKQLNRHIETLNRFLNYNEPVQQLQKYLISITKFLIKSLITVWVLNMIFGHAIEVRTKTEIINEYQIVKTACMPREVGVRLETFFHDLPSDIVFYCIQ